MSIGKHIKEHAMLGVGLGEKTLTVGDGGQFATVQAAYDSIDLTTTYDAVSGTGQIQTWANGSDILTGTGTNFGGEVGAKSNYVIVSGDTKAYRVKKVNSDTSLVVNVTRQEVSISGPLNYQIVRAKPVTIKLLSNMTEGVVMAGALGFVTIDYNNFSIDKPIQTWLESGAVSLINMDGLCSDYDPDPNNPGYITAFIAGGAPAGAILNYRIANASVDILAPTIGPRDVVYVNSSGDWDVYNFNTSQLSGDIFRFGNKGRFFYNSGRIITGVDGTLGISAGAIKQDMGGLTSFSQNNDDNYCTYRGLDIDIYANVSTSNFIEITSEDIITCNECNFNILAGNVGSIGSSGYIKSGAGMNGVDSVLEFNNCNIDHAAGVSEGAYAVNLGFAVGACTMLIKFNNSDVFPGSVYFLGSWTITIEHYNSRNGIVAVGAADRTGQIQDLGKNVTFDTTSANRNYNLPPAAYCKYGTVIIEKETGESTYTVGATPSGAETINGVGAAYTSSVAYARIILTSNGTSWSAVSEVTQN